MRGVPGLYANDGVSTYTVSPGTSAPGDALWNFDFYANVTGNPVGSFTFKLLYSLTPNSANTGILNLGSINGNTPGPIQDSENLGFAFLNTTTPPFTVAPPGAFDPNATGEYDFTLEAVNSDNRVEASETMIVDVVGSPEVTSTLPLLGAALIGLAFASRKLKAKPA
jgi:hypothetical protein